MITNHTKFRSFRIILILVSFILVHPLISVAGEFNVVRVYDGDTIKATGHYFEIKIRLAGIDSPEASKGKRQPGQPFCQKAKKYLSCMVLYETVEIKRYGFDRYGRTWGVVYLDGKNINLEMIKAGLAEFYREKSPKGFNIKPYIEAEEQARKTRCGMWVQEDKYMSPKEWRKKSKGK